MVLPPQDQMYYLWYWQFYLLVKNQPDEDLVLYYPDGTISQGLVEDNIGELDDTVVQFERTGFVRLEGDKAFFLHR